MKKFAVILAGSGVYDGSEIHEATMSLYAIMKYGGTYEIFAPDIKQHHVINHISGEEMKEERNVLVESARIARGKIQPLNAFNADHFDALLIPGGFGAAKNLSDFAFNGAKAGVHIEVKDAIQEMNRMGKPIGALCIAPALIALTLDNIDLTIGNDEGTAKALEELGSHHVETTHGDVVYDKDANVFTTPCYMLDANILEIAAGAENIVKAMMDSMA